MRGISDFGLVIFDCDGVVVDSEVLACRALAETLSAYGLATSTDQVFDRFLGRSFSEVEKHWRTVRDGALPDGFRADNARRLAEAFRAGLRPMPGIRELLAALASPFCLASSSDPGRIRLALCLTGLESVFADRIYSAAAVARGKPAPDLFLHVAGAMRAVPGETLVIEDTVTGVAAGKAAGMTVWGFTGGSHFAGREGARGLADAGAVRVVASLAELMP